MREKLEALIGLAHYEFGTFAQPNLVRMDAEDRQHWQGIADAARWLEHNLDEILAAAELDERLPEPISEAQILLSLDAG